MTFPHLQCTECEREAEAPSTMCPAHQLEAQKKEREADVCASFLAALKSVNDSVAGLDIITEDGFDVIRANLDKETKREIASQFALFAVMFQSIAVSFAKAAERDP